MELFERQFEEVRQYMGQAEEAGNVTEMHCRRRMPWPSHENRNLVLAQDTAVELGNPTDESTAFLLWGNDCTRIVDGRIRLVGPDLSMCRGRKLAFGKVALIGGDHFTEENAYDRYREMEGIRFDTDLKGYMIRAASQYQREWSRVSREAMDGGFSFHVLGGALMDRFRGLDYVRAVEIIFVTSGRDDVLRLKRIAQQVGRITRAMNKMVQEMSFDCRTCEFEDVCAEVSALRSIKKRMEKRAVSDNG